MDAYTVKREVLRLADPERAASMARFFKTGPGQYAHGDEFLGLAMPQQRIIVHQFRHLVTSEVEVLVRDPIHECRMIGLLIWVNQIKQLAPTERNLLVDRYLANRQFVNNWDLVDATSPYLLGEPLLTGDRFILYELANEAQLWSNRMALTATLAFIRRGQFCDTFSLIERLLAHPHDLIHKAMGWMLREVGKRNSAALEEFLHDHLRQLPRITLRYAIERMPVQQRQDFLSR